LLIKTNNRPINYWPMLIIGRYWLSADSRCTSRKKTA